MATRKPADPPAYLALRAESERTGWPTYFRRDLTVHDRRFLRTLAPGTAFVWALRDCGTHVYTLDFRDSTHDARGMVRCLADTWPETKFYIWDGVALLPMRDADAAREWIAEHKERQRAAAEVSP